MDLKMILVIGGAYQGKLEYVIEKNPGKTVFQCSVEDTEPDLSADIINSLHLSILAQIRAGIDPLTFLVEKLPGIKDKIMISDDISCGVIPIKSEARQWREATGRCLTLLSKNADEVTRVFCGIGSRIK
jgi:adenosyl cobinamide kinase/adenosyl cobinamide phosphate guanylyltransferase